MTPKLANPSIALEPHCAIRRTGTDLQNEEISIGTARSRTRSDDQMRSEHENEFGEVSPSHDTSLSEHSTILEVQGQNLSRNYYQFEWFRILIGMMLLLVSEVIIYGLVIFGGMDLREGLGFFEFIIVVFSVLVAVILFVPLLYTGTFVVLMEYHEAMGKFLYRYARLPPGMQHICLRLCAYFYAVGAVTGLSFCLFKLWLNFKVVEWPSTNT